MEMEKENDSVFVGSPVKSSICKDHGVKQDNLKLFSICVESIVAQVY
jgi:hypothetical protein